MSARALRRLRKAGILARVRARGLLFSFLIVAASPAAWGDPPTAGGRSVPHPYGSIPIRGSLAAPTSGQPSVRLPVPRPLIPPGLDLRAPPVRVPLRLRIPSLQVSAPVLGVGLTFKDVMDAPMGSADDPVWQEAFWYRGGGIPGDVGTATIAGHVGDGRGPALFAHLHNLRRGELIVVHDARNGLDVRFAVTATRTYSLEQLADTSVLARIYGAGPVSGRGPLAAPDGVSRLTLITCAGDYAGSSYDHRLVVYAERTN